LAVQAQKLWLSQAVVAVVMAMVQVVVQADLEFLLVKPLLRLLTQQLLAVVAQVALQTLGVLTELTHHSQAQALQLLTQQQVAAAVVTQQVSK
jgi:hypothetical protein